MRCLHFDLLRLLACLMIVAMHAPLPGSEGDGVFLSALSYLTAPGVGLFFMVSGALLLPVKTGTKAFLERRFVKIAKPTAAWTLFYMACNILLRGEPLTLRSLLSIPFSAQGTPVLWFIYTLSGLYLLAPILSRWLLATVSQLTFGVYLVHIFVMRYVLWRCTVIQGLQPYWLQTVVIALLTAGGSLALTWLVSLLPGSRYLIGK